MKIFYKIIFVFILTGAIFMRLYHLDTLPPSLNWDEISHGVNAQSLLQTGKDQWGISWPIFNFRSYGDFPTTLNLYLTIPFIKIFGLSALAIRLPSALMGILLVISTYFISLLVFKNKSFALVTMLLVSLSPWSLFTSRAVFQSIIAQGLFPLGFIFFFLALKRPKFFALSALFFGLSMYAYHSTRIITVPIVLALIFINFSTLKKINKKILAISLLTFLFFAVPSLVNLTQPESRARSQWVSILSPAAINEIHENRRLYTGPSSLNRLINNRVVYFIPRFVGNYLNQFNPIPLFFEGTGQYQFNIPHTGLLFPVTLPFFYIGFIVVIIKSRHQRLFRSLLAWHFVGLLPAVITTGDYPMLRAMTILPLPFIYISLGLEFLLSGIKFTKIVLISIIFILFVQSFLYIKNYLTQYFQKYSSSWQYGYQQVIEESKILYPNYDHIYFTKKYGEPHEFILFYWPWIMSAYQSDPNLKWNFHSDWYWVDAFDKFIFFNDWESPSKLPPRSLLITSPGNFTPFNAKLLRTVKFLNGQPAFDIVSYD